MISLLLACNASKSSRKSLLACVFGENMSAARFLNSEARIELLFNYREAKKAEVLAKEVKRKQRSEKRFAKQAKCLQKNHAKDKQREAEKPIVDVLVRCGFMERAEGKPTVSILRSFAKKQGLKPGTRARSDLIRMLLEAIQRSPAKDWVQAEGDTQESEPSESDPSSESEPEASSDDEDDLSDWEDTKIIV